MKVQTKANSPDLHDGPPEDKANDNAAFKKGDTVYLINAEYEASNGPKKGSIGTVAGVDVDGDGDCFVSVSFPGFSGHKCMGEDVTALTPDANGWWILSDDLRLLP